MSKSRSSAALMASRLIAMAAQFFALPFYVRQIGDGGYGNYIFLVNLSTALFVLDFGALLATRVQLAAALEAGDEVRTRLILNSVWRWWLAAWLVGSAVFVAVMFLHHGLPSDAWPQTPLARAAIASFYFGIALAVQALVGIIGAAGEFSRLSVAAVLGSLCAVAASVPALILRPSPFTLTLTYAVGFSVQASILGFVARKRFSGVPRLEGGMRAPSELRKLYQFGFPDVRNRLMGILGNTMDKILLEGYRPAMLGQYALCAKVPEISGDLVGQINGPVFVEMARTGGDRVLLAERFGRNVSLLAAMAAALVLIPAGFAAPILHLWLRDRFVPMGEYAMPAVAVYIACDQLILAFVGLMQTQGLTRKVFPFSAFNAVGTVTLTLPAAHWLGIAGVGLMNAFIGLITLSALAMASGRHALETKTWYRLAPRFARIVFFGILAMSLGHLIATRLAGGAWWSLTALPVLELLFLLYLVKGEGIELPKIRVAASPTPPPSA